MEQIIGKTIKYIDNHAHLNFKAFDEDREETIARALGAGVALINVGTQKDTSKQAVELAEKHANCFAIVGLHPVHTSKSFHDEKEIGSPTSTSGEVVAGKDGMKGFMSRTETFDYEYYKDLCKHPKVVGVGECGLDYYRITNYELGITNEQRETEEKALKKQEEIFRQQIELSIETKKPLMLHIREAYKEALEILKKYPGVKGNAHFFAGTIDEAKQFLDLGITLSFTGVITFPKITQYRELVEFVPLNMILSETDCPYVAPVPYRGKRNEPAYVVEVVKKIAEIKNLPLDEVAEQLRENSKRVWGI